MSMNILWPSLLTTIGGDSVFWLPTINDNMRLLDDVLSPAAALLPVSGAARPNRMLSWDMNEDGTYFVRQGDCGRGIAGVAVGHPRDSGDILTKLYGGIVVETSHDISNADTGKLAVLNADGTVYLTSTPPAEYDTWVGVVVGVARARRARVILRYFSSYTALGGYAFTRNSARPYAPIGGGVLVPDVGVGPAGYAESHVFFTYLGSYDDDHPELYNTAVVGVNTGGDAANFQVSGGLLVQGSSGAELTLHLERPYAVATGQASILDAAEFGGAGVNVACDVSGQLVKITLGTGTWQGQGVRQLMVSVTGILAEG